MFTQIKNFMRCYIDRLKAIYSIVLDVILFRDKTVNDALKEVIAAIVVVVFIPLWPLVAIFASYRQYRGIVDGSYRYGFPKPKGWKEVEV